MAEVITMLALSPTMEEGTLVEWLKSEGDPVAEGELIAEIETDKATMEMESFHDGTLLKIIAKKGDAVPVGAPLAIIGDAGEDVSDLLSGLLSTGAPAATETPAETQTAPVPVAAAPADVAATPSKSKGGRRFVSPLARKIAGEKSIDLSTVTGSGPHGRIIARDLDSVSSQPVAAASALESAADFDIEPMSQIRKTIAKRLGEAWTTTPTFFLTTSIDMGPAMAQRKSINQQLADADAGVKISVNDLIVKACANALTRFPDMNVSYGGDHLKRYNTAHVSVAVAIDGGLITPTVRNADLKSLSVLSSEIRELVGRAKDKRLKPEEYTGGTFSVSNLGMYGIEHFTAIINPPQSGILACGAVAKVPIINDDGELTVGTQMKVTLSCDHRAVDGAVGSLFLNEVKRLLENPILMLV